MIKQQFEEQSGFEYRRNSRLLAIYCLYSERVKNIFLETCKWFFDKNHIKDLLWLIVGLVSIFTFANVMMPEWPFIFFAAAMVFTSSLYRFVMVDKDFASDDVKMVTRKDVLNFIVGKNAFVILFSISIFIVVIISSSIFDASFLNINFLMEILTYSFFVLGSENIIYIFHNKSVEGYASGSKRDEIEDIKIGIENFKDQIPSLIMICFLLFLFFVIGFRPSIYFSIFYYTAGTGTLIYFKKKA